MLGWHAFLYVASRIIAAALKSCLPEDRSSFDLIEQMVRAAIAAAPEARNAIVFAALGVCPWARECILAAARIDVNETAFFHLAGGAITTPTGTLNPANFFTWGESRVQSPEQPPAR